MNNVHHFQWPEDEPALARSARESAAASPTESSRAGPCGGPARPYRPVSNRHRAGLSAYLNASIRPAIGTEWVIVPAGAQQHADFLSVLVPPRGNGVDEVPTAAQQAASGSRVPSGTSARYVRGAAPAAALCHTAAVKNGTPSGGLRLLLELIPPQGAEACRACPPGTCGAGVDDQRVLYRAIAALVAANTRSPCSKPVMVLTNLQNVWKLIWLGRAGGASGGSGDVSSPRHGMRNASSTGLSHGGAGSAAGGSNNPNTDVFVWRLDAPDAVSVLRSMLAEESMTWDGEVSSEAHGVGGGLRSIWANFRSGGGPMTSFRNRCSPQNHAMTGAGSGADGTETRTPSPPPVSYVEQLRPGTSYSTQSTNGRCQQIGGEMARERHPSTASAPGRAMVGFSGAGSGAGTESPFSEAFHTGPVIGYMSHNTSNGGSGGEHREHRYHQYVSNGYGSASSHDDSGYPPNGYSAHLVGSRIIGLPGFPSVVNPLVAEPQVLDRLIPFLAGDGYLFVAGVCKGWRKAWGVARPQETYVDAAVQSPSRLGWARASGCAWSGNVCARAAGGGYLATLRYARAIRCPWDWRTCATAAAEVRVRVCVYACACCDVVGCSCIFPTVAETIFCGHWILLVCFDFASLGYLTVFR